MDSNQQIDGARELLAAYQQDYFTMVGAMSWDELERRQQGRLVSLAFGGAGIAYACWYAARARSDERLLMLAERWILTVLRRRRSLLAFHGTAVGPRAELAPAAFVYGVVGLYFTRALIAHESGNRRARTRALARLEECCRDSPEDSWDLYSGSAGALIAVSWLHREIGGRRLAVLGQALAAALSDRARMPQVAAGDDRAPLGLGHGVGGALYAWLVWAGVSGTSPPAGFASTVERFVHSALEAPATFCPPMTFRSSVCNGFAGLTFLAARAYEVFGGSLWHQATCRAAALALESLPPRTDLCCGRVGVAYACLAAGRLEPAGPWRRHALELALSALLVERSDWEVAGLFGGEAGLACLVEDLLAGLDGSPPCLGPVPAAGVGR